MRHRVLFLCTGNSCRSQMAEGLARVRWGDEMSFASAGIERHGLNPLAVRAMAELDIDISGHDSKTVGQLERQKFDVVITVCGHAHETCPLFPGEAMVVHRGFDDPPYLARSAASEDDAMVHYRRVRDELRDFIEDLPAWIAQQSNVGSER